MVCHPSLCPRPSFSLPLAPLFHERIRLNHDHAGIVGRGRLGNGRAQFRDVS